jgi:hypothetical protein
MMQKRNKQLLNQGKTLNKELQGYASLDDCGRHAIVAAPYIKKVYSHPKEEGKCYHIPYYVILFIIFHYKIHTKVDFQLGPSQALD